MTLFPNAGNRIPEDGDYNGNAIVAKPVAHPALPTVPGRIADVDDAYLPNYVKFHRIASAMNVPPVSVLSALLAKEWTINMSVEATGVTLSAIDETFSFSGADIGERIDSATGFASYSKSEDNEVDEGLDTVQVTIEAGDPSSLWFGYGDGEWSLPVRLRLLVTSSSGGYSGLYSTGYQNAVAFGSALAGVAVTICGVAVTLYLEGASDTFTASGTITLEPTEWLGLAP